MITNSNEIEFYKYIDCNYVDADIKSILNNYRSLLYLSNNFNINRYKIKEILNIYLNR